MSKKLGDIAEQKACNYLKQRGYKIVQRNYYCRFGEIDIIATKEGHYHFFEVKSGSAYDPIYDITPQKLQKIIKAVNIYLKAYKITSTYSIDALSITDRVEIYENITF